MHADAEPLSRQVGASVQLAEDAGLLTDTTVAAANTNDGLQAAVTAAVVHADVEPAKARVNRALEAGEADGTLEDADVAGLTTVDELKALTQGASDDGRALFDE
jgi:hypothetical protein